MKQFNKQDTYILLLQNDYVHFVKKATKNNLRIMPKQYAHLQTMTLTPVEFQSNRSKTVGVPYTGYLVSIHFGCKND